MVWFRFSHYHWLNPSIVGTGVVGVAIVGSGNDGGYSPQYGYGPAAGLFYNEGYMVTGYERIGSLN